MEVKLIAITPNAEQLIEHAGHVCYAATGKDGEDTAGFVQKRIRQGHLSLTEHAVATVEISGISRACSHQLVRHRLASYSQESQRYVSWEDICHDVVDYGRQEANYAPCTVHHSRFFVKPDSISEVVWVDAIESSCRAYLWALEDGAKPEDARYLLPNAAKTSLVMTANLREWRYIIKLRTDPASQWEIHELASRVRDILVEEVPSVFGDLE